MLPRFPRTTTLWSPSRSRLLDHQAASRYRRTASVCAFTMFSLRVVQADVRFDTAEYLARGGMITPEDLEQLAELVESGHVSPALLARITTVLAGVGQSQQPDADRYELVQLIGEGGAGAVWLARDRVLERDVAVKVLHSHAGRSGSHRARFLYEARTTGLLANPGIIPVYDAGQLRDGELFYSMQRITGRDLRAILADLRDGNAEARQTWPLPRLLRLFAQVCLTLAYAHDSGIIHRDLKPANIMLGEYDEVYVADWGLAKCYDDSKSESFESRPGDETTQGSVLGTLHYMSPEQLDGHVDVGPPTDVYSLGVILYEILTLQLPFTARSTVRLMFEIATAQPRDPRDVALERDIPDELAELALAAIAKEPDDRVASARYLAERIQAFLDGAEEAARRQRDAEGLFARATELAQELVAQRAALADAQQRLDQRRSELSRHASLDERKDVWALEQDLHNRRLEAERCLSEALWSATRSYEYDPRDKTRIFLARLYGDRAAHSTDPQTALHFRLLAQQYDRTAVGSGSLMLAVEADGEVSTLVERFEAFGPVTMRQVVTDALDQLPAGSYLVTASADGHVSARLPVVVSPGQHARVSCTLPRRFDGCDDLVYVHGGTFVVGGDDQAPRSLRPTPTTVEPHFIGKYPVTLAEYCEFLTDIAQTDPDKARSHVPRSGDGTVWLDYDEPNRIWRVPEVDDDGDAWDPQWPAHMLNWHDAVAYCAWLSDKDGHVWRLPTEQEWELAARGMDGRQFPWGSGFDPTLCHMSASIRGKPIPAPVGSYPFDESPYGVCDMAGLVMEWTSTVDELDPTHRIQRGGGTTSPPDWCRAAARKSNDADWLYLVFGFRVVRELGGAP